MTPTTDSEQGYWNPDGSPASWVEPIPLRSRRRGFLKGFAPGLILALTIWVLQYVNGKFGQDYLIVGLAPLVIGALIGVAAYRKTEIRKYSMIYVEYTSTERLKRASKYWAIGIVAIALIWGIQASSSQLAVYWWYAWPTLLPLFIGTGLFLLRGESRLTTAANSAKIYYDALEQNPPSAASRESTEVDTFIESAFLRYPVAAALLYGAYYFASDSAYENGLWLALGCVIFAGICAYELAGTLLGIGLLVALGWAIYSGLAALPVSIAIIVGALIIASALRK